MTSADARHPGHRRLLIIGGIALGLLIFFGANAHLLYVAMTARSDCVEHLKVPADDESDDRYRAARSAC